MPEFRVYRNTAASCDHYPFLIDVQSELLSALATRLVIPLVASAGFGKAIKNLNPTVTIGGTHYSALAQQMAAVPRAMLGEAVEGAEVDRGQILSAIDFLVTGI